ncbi:MAG: hypothetical protein U5J63_14500 [Fodinibius sp.]|nr:hypothetical protein [Fodinibius sp.]
MNSHGILIFDQEEAVRESLHLVFSEEGFHCLSTGDEVQALRLLLSEPISLLILDSQVREPTYIFADDKKGLPCAQYYSAVAPTPRAEVTTEQALAQCEN